VKDIFVILKIIQCMS